jgi:hypothetical protein
MPPGHRTLYSALRLRRERGWLGALSARALRVDDALLEHYNWRKGCAYPGYETLRRETRLSRDSISEALRELEFYGRWVIHRTPRRPNIYCLPPELVPEVPAERYVPSARWTRKERLKALRPTPKDAVPQSRASSPMSSRASHPMQSRASSRVQSSALDRNYAVELRSVNYAEELRRDGGHGSSHVLHSPDGEEVRNEHVQRYRAHWLSVGGDEEMFPAVRRALAAALRCDEEEAGNLLRQFASKGSGMPGASAVLRDSRE